MNGEIDRERWKVDRERGKIDRERGKIDRERGKIDREREEIDRERDKVDRERGEIDRERAKIDREPPQIDRHAPRSISINSYRTITRPNPSDDFRPPPKIVLLKNAYLMQQDHLISSQNSRIFFDSLLYY
ncbi:hypothetical protein [Lentibacillus halophilus]|uniref:hypothetical protein n=1 Tax=Lentibacillus halophilus TaxID=295065 RepID=UPI0031D00A3C